MEGARRLSGQFTRATLLIFAAVTAIVVGGLFWATHRSDQLSIQRQERVAIHSMEVALDELAQQQETVAVWDDAERTWSRPGATTFGYSTYRQLAQSHFRS